MGWSDAPTGHLNHDTLASAVDLFVRRWPKLRRCEHKPCEAWCLPTHGRQRYHDPVAQRRPVPSDSSARRLQNRILASIQQHPHLRSAPTIKKEEMTDTCERHRIGSARVKRVQVDQPTIG